MRVQRFGGLGLRPSGCDSTIRVLGGWRRFTLIFFVLVLVVVLEKQEFVNRFYDTVTRTRTIRQDDIPLVGE